MVKVASFNLLRDPWMPVSLIGKGSTRVSLVKALLDASSLAGFEHEDPLVVVSCYRLALAFLHRALHGPDSVEAACDWLRNGFPASRIDAYADKWVNRFELFDPDTPFYQQPGLANEKFRDHWSRLVAARGSFNTNPLYRHELRSDEPPGDAAKPGDAVLHLIAHQTFALGGLTKRFITSAKGAPFATSALTLVQGRNLLETLCLNLVAYDGAHAHQDAPVWESRVPTLGELRKNADHPATGLTESYTWRARSIQLLVTEDTEVEWMYYAEGVNPGPEPYPDPMVGQRQNAKGDWFPLGFREDRAMWRDLHCFVPQRDASRPPEVISWAEELLYFAGDLKRPIEFAVFGMENNKAKIVMTRQEQLRLPHLALQVPSLRKDIQDWVDKASQAAYRLEVALQILAFNLITNKKKTGGKELENEVKAQLHSFQYGALFWPEAERLFWEHLAQVPSEVNSYQESKETLDHNWAGELRRLGTRVFNQIAATLDRAANTLRAIELGRFNLLRGGTKTAR